MKKIGIACDHAGYEMKEFLVGYLDAMGYEQRHGHAVGPPRQIRQVAVKDDDSGEQISTERRETRAGRKPPVDCRRRAFPVAKA